MTIAKSFVALYPLALSLREKLRRLLTRHARSFQYSIGHPFREPDFYFLLPATPYIAIPAGTYLPIGFFGSILRT